MRKPLPTEPPARTTATGTLLNQPHGTFDGVHVLIDPPGPPPDWHAGARFRLVPCGPEDYA